ncbi:cathepsin B-like [Sitophilus oryzae]|uniref:Cathepsin B-like n=1 Tax=Sitophilus oryzae TaxID=7048 RepID=A0A6J2X9Q0_SITOR|nr:cathepsin B-like [Sitophilus oryzae]
MKLKVLFLLFISSSLCTEEDFDPFSNDFVDYINQKQSRWIANRSFDKKQIQLLENLFSGDNEPKITVEFTPTIHNEDEELPESFDAREAWPDCADIIGFIRDQSTCGSCWAFSTAEAISDRICIHSNATRKVLVSAQDILTCSSAGGCHGGTSVLAWEYWKNGYVTGGLYNDTNEGCKSYFLPPCNDHMNNCTNYVDTPECVSQCDDSKVDYNQSKTYGHLSFRNGSINGTVKQIQLEILKNGPVQTTFTVYEDFAYYKSGIYQYTAGKERSRHAVKIIGWGVEKEVEYWLIANSFNANWGEDGFFRMIRGKNDCGIEDVANGGLPDFDLF